MEPHVSVLKEEVVALFRGKEVREFFEGTVGAGGHAKALLEEHPEMKTYIALDRDPTALALARDRLQSFTEKVVFLQGSFGNAEHLVREQGVKGLDGFLLDIGVSSMQMDTADRGFSFQKEGPLDMRMDPSNPVDAAHIVQTYSEKDLADLFFLYGEERRSRAVAAAIVRARKKQPLTTTTQLVAVLESVLGRGKRHPATKVFQALRIAVNEELQELEKGITAALSLLRKGGILAVITFHSLEDRIVKWRCKEASDVEILTKKPLSPSREEVGQNRRARSAKLRAVRKV